MNETKTPYTHLIDSHFHLLAMQERGFDIASLLEEMETLGFAGGIDIAMSPDDHLKRKELVRKHPSIRIASGIGPWWLDKGKSIDEMMETLTLLCKENPPDAIGEIGLELFHTCGTLEEQKELFSRQIELANTLHLPIIIHNRDADDQMMNLLSNYTFPYGGIVHCFSSDIKFANFALLKGFLLSFAGPITYKKNKELREVLAHTPLSSLLLETDSPFLAPQDKRGKPNTPLYISSIYEKAAEVKGVDVSTIIESVNKNFRALFK